MSKHILFIHLPKTAGTSFRIAAEEYFEKENVFYDYSKRSSETSQEIIETIYNENDFYAFYCLFNKKRTSFLSGHFPSSKYARLYDSTNIVSIVRNPMEQVLSHYNHYKQHNGYEKDLHTFIKDKRFQNVQCRNIGAANIHIFGFIGVTEEYNTSIDIFNALYKVNFPYKQLNVKSFDGLNSHSLTEEEISLIKKYNVEDFKFYETVKKQFAIRKELYEKKLPFTYGFIQKNEKNIMHGLAFQRDNDMAVEIDIYLDDKYIETIRSNILKPAFVSRNVPRKSYVGFTYKYIQEPIGKRKLHAFVKSTGQEIL